ncbi:MAG: hypothetical protein DHS20C14_04720 [Phycisphaeraceae bacterium]|nr:MAG: hypothetical protein DHS20C14_04720 [Phycisphaeraceae bacterium]
MPQRTFTSDFKRFFGRGLAILLPSIVTLWLLWQAFAFVFTNVALPINRVIRLTVIEVVEFVPEPQRPGWYDVTAEQVTARAALRAGQSQPVLEPAEIEHRLRREQFKTFWEGHWYLEGAGLFIAILLIYLAGLLLSNFVGRQVYTRVEKLIARIPGFKQVYPHVKQLVDLILGDKKMAFSEVVLVEYPSKDIWTIGFLTGESIRSIDDSAGERVQSVFIPTSPTPFTGFTINVPKTKIRQLDMSVEEALRFVITAGVLTPGAASPAHLPRTEGGAPGPLPEGGPSEGSETDSGPDSGPGRENRRETA